MTALLADLIAGQLSMVAVMKLILFVSVVVGVAAGILAWRERPQPGSVPLTVLLVGQVWWSTTILFRLNATVPGRELFWLELSWLGTGVIPVAWLFFCIEYSGHHRYVKPQYIVLALVIPLATAVLSLSNGAHHLLYAETTVSQSGVIARSPGVWFWVIAGYTYSLGFLGAIPLLQFITSDVDMFRGQSLALLGGLLFPWLTNFFHLLGFLPTAGIDPTPAAFALSGVAYLGAIKQFNLFETTPAPIRQAHLTVFERMHDGAIVIDSRNYIVEMNRQAEQIIDTEIKDALGRQISEVIPAITPFLTGQSRSGLSVFRPERNSGAYDISIKQLRDSRGRTTGRMLTFHDISEYLRQQQRLEVLNRVFRHNVRTNTQAIIGKAEYLADHNSEHEAQNVQENALEIETISEKVRTVLDLFKQSRKQIQLVSLDRLLRDCMFHVNDSYPDVSINADLPDENVYVSTVLEPVFMNLIENAAEHNTSPDPQIRIEAEPSDDSATVVIADNGPGIDDEELSLLEDGTETPLKHGTGFGLAIIIWGTAIANGEIDFEDNSPTGLVATVELPLYNENDQTADRNRPVRDLLAD